MGGAGWNPEIGVFSIEESLTQGVTLLYRCLRLLLPFMLASLVGALAYWGGLIVMGVEGFGNPAVEGVRFCSDVVTYLIASWGTWLVIWRYGDQKIARLGEGPKIGGFTAFLMGENAMLPSIILLSLIISLISLARSSLMWVLSGTGLYFLSLVLWAIFWFINILLGFSIFGILIFRLPTTGAIGLSREIVSRNLLAAIGLMVGIMLISYGIGLIFSMLYLPLMVSISDMEPMQLAALRGVIVSPASGVVGAVRVSCMCFAFLSVIGRIDSIALAVKHGKALPECPGSPRLPDCEGCREMQDFGDKCYCTRFRVAVVKGDGESGDPARPGKPNDI